MRITKKQAVGSRQKAVNACHCEKPFARGHSERSEESSFFLLRVNSAAKQSQFRFYKNKGEIASLLSVARNDRIEKPEKGKLFLLSIFFCLLLSAYCLLSFTHKAYAAPTYTLPEILSHMDETQKKVNSFQARFVQTKTIYLLEGAVKTQGELYFKRPGNLYWETKEPNRLVLVINENTLWLYFPDLREVDKMDITLLKGLINKYVGIGQPIEALKDQYDIKLVESGGKMIILDLLPKSPRLKSQIKSIRLWLNPATWFPQEVKNTDANGDTTHIIFQKIEINQPIPESRFNFTPPRGVKLKDQGSIEIPQ